MFNNIRHMFAVVAIAATAMAGACQSCSDVNHDDLLWYYTTGHEYIVRDSIQHANARAEIDDYTDVIDDGDYIFFKEEYVNYPSSENWEKYNSAHFKLTNDEQDYINNN